MMKPKVSELGFLRKVFSILTKPFLFVASGLTLYVGPDNTVSFDKRGSRKHYEPVVMRR